MSGVRPASVDKIVTSLMDRSSPNLEHSFPVPYRRNGFLGIMIVSCMCACATINGLLLASVQCLRLYISITEQDRRMVTIDHLYETAYGESSGHVIDDVTSPRKLKVLILKSLRLYMSTTVQTDVYITLRG